MSSPKVVVGRSAERSSAHAGAEAAAALQLVDLRLVLVFAAGDHDPAALLRGVRSVTGDTPVIGCSTAAAITLEGAVDDGVVAIGLGGPGLRVTVSAARDVAGDPRAAGAAAAACVAELGDAPHRALLLLSDGRAGDQEELVRGAYGVVGAAVPVVGGCASDDLGRRQTVQMFGDAAFSDGVVAAAIASDAPLGVGVCHGWQRVDRPLVVSRSEGLVIELLDELPALDVYLDRLDAPAEARVDRLAFQHFALQHPLGMRRRSGEELIRNVADADFDARTLTTAAKVPRGAAAWLMRGDGASVLEATDRACTDALAALGGAPPQALLAFDCIARRAIMGEEGIAEEISRLAGRAHGAPVAGFYSAGEIARTRGISGFHNQTLVVLAVG
jgi:hypothetical protein